MVYFKITVFGDVGLSFMFLFQKSHSEFGSVVEA